MHRMPTHLRVQQGAVRHAAARVHVPSQACAQHGQRPEAQDRADMGASQKPCRRAVVAEGSRVWLSG